MISPLAHAVAIDRQIADMEIELSKLRQQREQFINVAIEDGIKDDGTYRLILKTRRSINAERFRAIYPDVYDDIAVISATNAEKILGKELLREAVKARYPEAFVSSAVVNVGDAEKRLGKTGVSPECVVINTIPGSVKIVKMGEDDVE